MQQAIARVSTKLILSYVMITSNGSTMYKHCAATADSDVLNNENHFFIHHSSEYWRYFFTAGTWKLHYMYTSERPFAVLAVTQPPSPLKFCIQHISVEQFGQGNQPYYKRAKHMKQAKMLLKLILCGFFIDIKLILCGLFIDIILLISEPV